MDGICTIFSGIPQDPKEVEGLSHDEKYRHYVNAGNDPRTGGKEKLNLGKTSDLVGDGRPEPGRSCEVVGENGGVPLFNDPDCQLGIGSFTAVSPTTVCPSISPRGRLTQTVAANSLSSRA